MALVRQLITTTNKNYTKPIFKWFESQFKKISEERNDNFMNSIYGLIIFETCSCEWYFRGRGANLYEYELVLRFEFENDATLYKLAWG
jgi:hypothetical protein